MAMGSRQVGIARLFRSVGRVVGSWAPLLAEGSLFAGTAFVGSVLAAGTARGRKHRCRWVGVRACRRPVGTDVGERGPELDPVKAWPVAWLGYWLWTGVLLGRPGDGPVEMVRSAEIFDEAFCVLRPVGPAWGLVRVEHDPVGVQLG